MKTPDAIHLALKNILYTTDLSSAAEKALPYAVEFAHRYDAKVYVVHVAPPEVYPFQLPETWPQMAEAEEMLREKATQDIARTLSGIAHELLFVFGPIWCTIAKIIEEKDIDLLVLGTHGRTGIGKALMGSVAEKVFRLAKCPVLTVGPCLCTSDSARLDIKRILYATDFSHDSLAAAPYAISLAQEKQGCLTLLHCTPDFDNVDARLDQLRDLVPAESSILNPTSCLVKLGHPAIGILEAASERSADLIVLGVHNANWARKAATNFFDSTAYKIVTRASCPVLTVRSQSQS